jgi:hypothetical protein
VKPLFLYDLPDLPSHATAHPPSRFPPAQHAAGGSTWNLLPQDPKVGSQVRMCPDATQYRSGDAYGVSRQASSPSRNCNRE